MTDINHEALREAMPEMLARCEAATKEPWMYVKESNQVCSIPLFEASVEDSGICTLDCEYEAKTSIRCIAEGEHIAHARKDLPLVLAHYEDLVKHVRSVEKNMLKDADLTHNSGLAGHAGRLTEILDDGMEEGP